MLILSRKIGEKIIIGSSITILVIEVHGDVAKLGIDAPASVRVYRQELFLAIQEENKTAATSVPKKLPSLFPKL